MTHRWDTRRAPRRKKRIQPPTSDHNQDLGLFQHDDQVLTMMLMLALVPVLLVVGCMGTWAW